MCALCTCKSSVLDLMEDAQRVILLIFFLPYEEVVLILILMEHAQRELPVHSKVTDKSVFILILMEHAQREGLRRLIMCKITAH